MVENQKTNLTKKQTEELLKLAAKNYILNGFDYEHATVVYKKLLALDSANVENLVEYAQFIESRDKNGEAIEYYSKAYKISSNDYVKAHILNELGNLKNKLGYPLKDVYRTYNDALDLITKHDSLGINENRDVISVFINIANYQKKMHRYSDAEKYYIHSINSIRNIIELYNDNRDRLLMATYLTNLGCLRTDMRKFDLAEENLVDALNIFRKEPANDSLFYQADFINNLNCIGRLNLLQKKTDSAEPYFIEALSRSRACMKLDSLKYLSTLCTSLDNLGMCKAQMNDFENAERYCNEALSLANKRKETHSKTNDFLLSVILFDEATMKVIKGERELAVQYFSRSLNIRRELAQDKPETYTVSIIEGLNALSKVYIQNNEYDRAEGTLLESLCLCYKLKYEWINEYDIEIFETYRVLSDLAVKCGDVKEVNIYSNEALAYCSLLQKKDLKGFEPEKNRIVKELESVSKNKKKQEKTEKLTRDDSVDYSEWMGTLSYFLILERKFNEAEYFATKALILSPAKIWIKTNLALSLLLQGKLKEAQPIYIELKDKTYPPEKNKKFKEIFLQDLDEIEAEGIYQSDITKIRSILVE
jgi:tetratricopeptide (TPR) repeat protein